MGGEGAAAIPRRAARWAAWLTAAALFCGALAFVADGPQPGDSRFLTLALALLGESLLVLLWLAAAAGFGVTLAGVLFGSTRPAACLQLAIGAAVMFMLAWLLGLAGWLNTWSAWLINGLGWALWVFALRQRLRWPGAPSMPTLLAMPAAGLLVGAATIAPGVLWKLQGRGPGEHLAYDVLSRHLQLPREWMAIGAIRGLEHNVFAYMPNAVEAAYLHVGWMRGGMIHAGIACQLLHAALAVLAATVVATLVRDGLGALSRGRPRGRDEPGDRLHPFGDEPRGARPGDQANRPGGAGGYRAAAVAGASAGAVYLAAPWVITTGSIAFNEQAMIALGGAGLAIALSGRSFAPGARGLASGGLCGMAGLCSLAAVGLFALPTALVLLWRGPMKPLPRMGALLTFAVGLAIPLGLFALRNLAWTGNPIFPLATGVLGTAHWTAEQAARWQAEGIAALPLPARVDRAWQAIATAPPFAYALAGAALVGAFVALAGRTTRRVALMLGMVAVTQALFWLTVTSLGGRLALPLLVPGGAAIGLGLAVVRHRLVITLIAAALVGWLTVASYRAYDSQLNGYAAAFIDGAERLMGDRSRWGPINALPPGSRVYAEGFAIPFYAVRPIDYHTRWDRSKLGRHIEAEGIAGGLSALRREGYTHLLIDWGMLGRWMGDDGAGYDRRITKRRLELIQSAGLPVVAEVPGKLTLYRLDPGD